MVRLGIALTANTTWRGCNKAESKTDCAKDCKGKEFPIKLNARLLGAEVSWQNWHHGMSDLDEFGHKGWMNEIKLIMGAQWLQWNWVHGLYVSIKVIKSDCMVLANIALTKCNFLSVLLIDCHFNCLSCKISDLYWKILTQMQSQTVWKLWFS